MKSRLLFFAIVCCLPVVSLFSQTTANYSFSNANNGSLTDMSTGSTDILIPSSVTGDFASSANTIGFDFWLMGTRYANFSVNSNGLMRLGKTAVSNTGTNSLATGTNLPLLAPFWDNLNSYSTSSTSKVRTKLTGTTPNRVLTVEWKDFIISSNSSSSTEFSTFQVKLYETTGVFEYVYGRMQIATGSSTVTASIGMTNSNANNGLIYVTSLNMPAVLRTTAGAVNNLVNSSVAGTITKLNATVDGTRVRYTFTPPSPNAATSDLSFTAIGSSNMTLNWTCGATNELGFAIYRSDDGGLTYNYISQAAANATSSVQGGLEPSTNYYWKVYAVTEGALGSSVNGNQATLACAGAAVNNSMTLTGSGTYNWNTAANWSLGHTPTACENAVVTFNYTSSGIATAIVNLNSAVTVNKLTINGVYGGSLPKLLQVITNSYALTVLGDLSMSATGGSGIGSSSNEVDLLAGTGSVVTVKGNCIIGQPADSRTTAIGGGSGQFPDFYFKGNVTFNSNAATSYPGTYYFDGGVSQSLTNNASAYLIWFGNVEVGKAVSTSLTLAGSNATTYVNSGNLVVYPASSMILPYDKAFNQFTVGGGGLQLKANATLKLGDYFGGQAGSNFPVNFGYLSIDPASTVEYYYAGAYSPVVYSAVTYGNLVLTNASRKYISSDLFINGNFTISNGSVYGSDYGTYIYGSSFINNGSVDGLYANSRLGFYGNASQSYSGTGNFGTVGAPFAMIDIYNPAAVVLNAAVHTNRVNLFTGTLVNSGQLKLGTSSYGLIQRGGVASSPAGAFDNYPVINCPNNLTLRYDNASAPSSSGYEIPASAITKAVYSNNQHGVALTGDLTVTNDLQLLQQTLNIGAYTLKLDNTITKTAGNINGSAGTVEMNGNTAQTIPANTFQANNLKNLLISNTNNVSGVTLSGTLDIYRSVTFGAGGRKLTTGSFLTFKSNATETAWLGQLSASNTLVGDATVERYIPLHSKAWQLLSTPITATSTQTIKQAWQEGASAANGNPVPGYGTQLTSSVANAASQPKPGFDVFTGAPSIKIYNSLTGSYTRLDSTTGRVSNPKGYMVLVRGDRSVTTAAGPATATILRTKGTLHTPANPPVMISIPTPGFESVGNPYAAAIDFRSLVFTGGVQPDFFYLWDPKLTTIGVNSSNGLGGFQSFSWNGSSFDVTPGGGSYAGSNRNIESGQAFFVNAPFAAGTVSFQETSKINGSALVNRVSPAGVKQLRTNLYVMNGPAAVLLDGNLVQYNNRYSNQVDINDGIKLSNSSENLGLVRDGRTLVVERRAAIQKTDTLFYKLGQVRIQQYQLEFIPTGIQEPGLVAFLEDNYLHTKMPVSLSDTTRLNVTVVNMPGSYATDRFRLVFSQAKQPAAVVTGMDNRGANVAAVQAKEPVTFSAGDISVYPNPVVDKTMQLHFAAQDPGTYRIQLTNKLGQVVHSSTIQLDNHHATKQVHLNETIAAGTYQLTIVSGEGAKISSQVIIN